MDFIKILERFLEQSPLVAFMALFLWTLAKGYFVPAVAIKDKVDKENVTAIATEVAYQVLQLEDKRRASEYDEAVGILNGAIATSNATLTIALAEMSESLEGHDEEHRKRDRDHQRWSQGEFDNLHEIFRALKFGTQTLHTPIPQNRETT